MALLVDPVTGAVVTKLLDAVLEALKDLKDRDENLQKLELLVQDLQPFVQRIESSAQDESVHLASQWLDHLQKELEAALVFIQGCRKETWCICVQVRSSRKSKKVYANILRLQSQAPLAQWAARLSTDKRMRDDVAETRAITLQMSEALHFEPSRFRKSQINRAASRRNIAVHMQNNNLTSSAPASTASSSSTPSMEGQYWNRDTDVAEPTVSFGGDNVAQQLISRLGHPERYRKWVGLWAMGGAGKTFTAKKIFNDDKIRQHFTGGRYWCTVSKDQPPIHELLKELFERVGIRGTFPDSLEDAKALLRSRFNRDKVLLILDDVWKPDVLEHLDLISDARDGVILVTTRDDNNLREKMDDSDIFQILPLSEEDSWKLFSWYAFVARGKDVPPDVEDVAKAVAKECKGLPLALQVIGSAMPSPKRLFQREVQHFPLNHRHEWEKILVKLQRANVAGDEYEALYRRLQLSIDNLNEEDPRLQDCFFSLAAFPEDYEIVITRLVSLWIAGGIVGNKQESLTYCEEEGEALVALLVSKSMIELIPSDQVDGNQCRIHDVMRDLARQNLQSKVDGEQNLFAPGLKLVEFPEQWTHSTISNSVERLSLHSNDVDQLPDRFKGDNLRVLILTANERLQTLPPGFFMSLSKLTVLDLSRTGVKEISGEILRCLKSLVLLDLSGCHSLRKIGDSTADLRHLQSIRLDGCGDLRALWGSPRVQSLIKLRAPQGPLELSRDEMLTKLHTLSLLGGEDRYSRSLVRPLNMIPWQGETLGPSKTRRAVINQALQVSCLKRLHIDLLYEYHWFLNASGAHNISPLTSLEELRIDSLDSFPDGIKTLRNLKTIKIFGFKGLHIKDPELHKLPFLEELVILNVMRSDIYLPVEFGESDAFPSLKRMWIERFNIYETFRFNPGAMPKIQTLKIHFESVAGVVSASLMVLGSRLNFLQFKALRADDNTIERTQAAFTEPSKYPNLEYLELQNMGRLPSTIALLPRLRWLRCNIRREEWPWNLVQLERQGKLKIEVVTD